MNESIIPIIIILLIIFSFFMLKPSNQSDQSNQSNQTINDEMKKELEKEKAKQEQDRQALDKAKAQHEQASKALETAQALLAKDKANLEQLMQKQKSDLTAIQSEQQQLKAKIDSLSAREKQLNDTEQKINSDKTNLQKIEQANAEKYKQERTQLDAERKDLEAKEQERKAKEKELQTIDHNLRNEEQRQLMLFEQKEIAFNQKHQQEKQEIENAKAQLSKDQDALKQEQANIQQQKEQNNFLAQTVKDMEKKNIEHLEQNTKKGKELEKEKIEFQKEKLQLEHTKKILEEQERDLAKRQNCRLGYDYVKFKVAATDVAFPLDCEYASSAGSGCNFDKEILAQTLCNTNPECIGYIENEDGFWKLFSSPDYKNNIATVTNQQNVKISTVYRKEDPKKSFYPYQYKNENMGPNESTIIKSCKPDGVNILDDCKYWNEEDAHKDCLDNKECVGYWASDYRNYSSRATGMYVFQNVNNFEEKGSVEKTSYPGIFFKKKMT